MFKKIIKNIFHLIPRASVTHVCNSERHGSFYGGWEICPDYLNASSIVYSFGIGQDISFDLSLISKYKLNVYGFDPTPKSVQWVKEQSLPKNFYFFEIGIADYDGTAKFSFPTILQNVSFKMVLNNKTGLEYVECKVNTLKSIMDELGHKEIDILKMDIEGSEYKVIRNILQTKVFPKQLLVEFHFRNDKKQIKETEQLISELRKNHYKVFSISKTGNEYSFILNK